MKTTRIGRRRLLLALAALAGLPAWPQTPNRPVRLLFIPTVGMARLHRKDPHAKAGTEEWLEKQFAEQGLVPRRDFTVTYVDRQLEDPDVAAIEQRAKLLLGRGTDVVMVGEDGIDVLMRVTKTIPLVFYQFAGDPVAFGLVASYGRPGGNVTGSTLAQPGTDILGWQLLKELSPKAKRLGVLWRDWELGEPWVPMVEAQEKAAAARAGFEWVRVLFPRTKAFAPVERAIRAARVDVLDFGTDSEEPWAADLARFVERERIPTLWGQRARVREGGLLAVHGAGGQAMVDAIAIAARIVRGAKPAEIPVSSPTRFIISINLRTARAMGLAIPPSVRVRATEVIE